MRRLLHVAASNSNKSNIEIIEIEFYANVAQITSANSDGDSKSKESKLNTYNKIFNTFIDNAIRLMKEKHSKIVDIHQSSRAGSKSWYVAMYPANSKRDKIKILCIFRFSAHSVHIFEEGSKQLNIPLEIVIRKDNNENHFKSFAEALDFLKTLLENEQS